MNNTAFYSLFSPKTVALVGASADPEKLGYRLAANLLSRPFPGTIYFVNPKGTEILGRRSYTSVSQLPESIDVVILAIPKSFMMTAVEECVQCKVRHIVALTAGFKEIGEEGIHLESQLKNLLAGTQTRLVGPNCAGYVHSHAELYATIEQFPRKGTISFISQSGSICSAFAGNIAARSCGIAQYLSLGNKVNVNENDLISYLADDESTNCIALYLEDIADGKNLRTAVERAGMKKPVVVFKSGSTPEGASATFSHTGAMAGNDRVAEGAFRQMGMIRCRSLTELYDTAAAFSAVPPFSSRKMAILSDAGGPGVIAADAAVSEGLKLPRISKETQKRLYQFLPAFSSVKNPIDMTFTRDVELYIHCIRELKAEGIGSVLVTVPSHFSIKDELVQALIDAKETYGIPIFVSWLAADEVEEQRRALWAAGIPAFADPQRAVAVVKHMCYYGEWLRIRK